MMSRSIILQNNNAENISTNSQKMIVEKTNW